MSKILSSVTRRLRDPDSTVRSACIDAVSSIASHITRPPFSSISKPLIECLYHEQDCNSQVGASLCFAAAIEAAPEIDGREMKKILPRILKLVKNECFKAKPALLSLIGSVASAGGVSGKVCLSHLVSTLVEFLSSENWAARKAAAEALGKLARAESNQLFDLKSTCLGSLQNRRFDKVKIVRDTMNQAIELWKDLPGSPDETESDSSCKDFVSKGCGFMTPHLQKTRPKVHSTTDSNSSTSSNKNTSPLKSDPVKPKVARSCEMDFQRPCNLKGEEVVPRSPSSRFTSEYQKTHYVRYPDSKNNGNCINSLPETKQKLSPIDNVENIRGYGGARYRARVVPLSASPENVSDPAESITFDTTGNHEEFENFTLIQNQICQIENQQSSLLDLLQRFIEHSNKGMYFLESRVNGLEKALDGMSHDLAMSSRRVSDTDAAGNGCCALPGADFLSPKFWRKPEAQSSSLKMYSHKIFHQSLKYSVDNDCNSGSKSGSPIKKYQRGAEVAMDSTGNYDASLRAAGGLCTHTRTRKTGEDAHKLDMRFLHGNGRPSLEPCMVQRLQG